MKIKRYFAADMRQALQMVREEQGPDAVILSNRKVDGGVEIVAAIDYDPAAVEQMARQEAVKNVAVGGAPSPRTAYVGTAPSGPITAETAAAAARVAVEPAPAKAVVWSQDPSITSM